MICGLVLAAGESRRMGQPKLLLPYEGKSIIETVLATVKKSKLKRSYVVIRPEDNFIPPIAQTLGLEVIINPEPAKGMLSSVIIGLEKMPEETEAIVLVLGDQPGISASIIDLLIVGYRLKGKGLVLPIFQGKRGHPVLIDLKYRQEIRSCPPDLGLRYLIHLHPEDILEISVNEPAVVMDVDTAEDYLRHLEGLKIKKS
ncbi:MAG: nucleotidyltransferase family protein [Candidatus Aminicenantes bacterium]|nr:nucleotidyltransferase family protein [Candidatus Aminicenantes bacterium]